MVSGLLITPPPAIMLQLSQGLWINALEIESVAIVNPGQITIMLRKGTAHYVTEFGDKDIAPRAAEIVDYVNHAARVYSGKVEYAPPKFKPSGQ